MGLTAKYPPSKGEHFHILKLKESGPLQFCNAKFECCGDNQFYRASEFGRHLFLGIVNPGTASQARQHVIW